MVLRITRGYSPEYLRKEVATGREDYYTGALAAGEPPSRWWGAGAEALGLTGLVDPQDMRAVYERFLDPRAEGFNDPSKWDAVSTLGHTGRKYLSEDELYAAAVERDPDAPTDHAPDVDGLAYRRPPIAPRSIPISPGRFIHTTLKMRTNTRSIRMGYRMPTLLDARRARARSAPPVHEGAHT